MPNRVVVTGVGPITPIGTGRQELWDGIVSQRVGIRRVDDLVDLDGISVQIGAPVVGFDPLDSLDPKHVRHLDRAAQFALVAANLALQDARLDPRAYDATRFGVVAGTGIGGMETFAENFTTLLEKGPRRVSPFFVPRLMPNAIAGEISIAHGLRGPNFGIVSACASGSHAVGVARDLIAGGLLDAAITGGSEAVMLRITYAGFARLGALSTRNDEPEKASRPFDAERDGFVMGEGAGFLVLESYDRAVARGAHIYAELAGFGMTADASHITAPAEDGDGMMRAMQMALERSGVEPGDVQYVNAHGTSTLPNDRVESLALKRVFGDGARRLKVSSSKSQFGHLLGAAGGVEAIVTVLAMEHGLAPATLNYEHPDPDCDLDYTPEPTEMQIETAISNSFGFGGQNACLLFRKVK